MKDTNADHVQPMTAALPASKQKRDSAAKNISSLKNSIEEIGEIKKGMKIVFKTKTSA